MFARQKIGLPEDDQVLSWVLDFRRGSNLDFSRMQMHNLLKNFQVAITSDVL